jgi:hypothetical protein
MAHDARYVIGAEDEMVRIEFETDSAAFENENGAVEVARILRDVARRIEGDGTIDVYMGRIADTNGNDVGYFEFRPSTALADAV